MSRAVRLSVIFYVPMLAGGFFLRPPGVLRVEQWERFGWGLAMAAGASAAVIALSRWTGRHSGWGRALRNEFRAVLGPLNSTEILWLALLSAFGEEILFRGIVQSWAGLWAAAALFAAFHFPYRRAMLPWTAFALAMGIGLGLLTEWAGSLWPAIWVHFCVNYFNLHDIAGDGAEEPAPLGRG